MKRPYAALSVLSLVVGLSSALYLGQSDYPYKMVGVRFCPTTANSGKPHQQDPVETQQELDRRYCRVEKRILKEVWEKKQYEASTPLPDTSLRLRTIPSTDAVVMWFLVAPVSMGFGYLAWAKKAEYDSMGYSQELESFKTHLAVAGTSARQERNFKSQVVATNWDKQRVEAGLISVDAIKDQLRRQTEVQEKTHAAALKQFDAGVSDMDKTIAENYRDAAIADRAREKSSSLTKDKPASTDKELANSLIEALKAHEDGWMWKIVTAIKPIWIVGDMGSAKTNMSVSLGLIRKYCLDIPVFRVADRHLRGDNYDVWKLLEAGVLVDNDTSILEVLQDCVERRNERIQNPKESKPEQFILDEFTQLAKIDKESVERFVTSTFSDNRKAKEYFIGVTHNLTNAAFGEGTAEMRKGAFYLEKFTADNIVPLPRVVVRTGLKDADGNNLLDVEKTLPAWFRAETIHAHLTAKKTIDF
jgi:hypothetical protein